MSDLTANSLSDPGASQPRCARGPLWISLLFLLLAIAALLAFAPTLSMPFFSDDIDLLERSADYREGVMSLREYLSLNHNEHRIPVMRLAVLAATAPGNLDARAFHLLVFTVHVGCATLLALMIAPWFGRVYALLGGVLFAVSGMFSSMVVWAPTSAVFSFSLFFILLARHAIVGGERPRVWLASIALLFAALSLNGSVVAVVPFCIGYWARLGPTRARRVAVAAAWLAAAALVFRWSSAGFVAPMSAVSADQAWHAARNGLFLLLSASVRWIRSWLAASGGSSPNVVELLGGTLAAALALGTLPRELRRQTVVLFATAALLALAIGYGRREQPVSMIYWTDRYYYAFGAPFAVASVALARRLLDRLGRRWLPPVLVVLVAVSGAMLTRQRIHPELTAAHILAHETAMEQARSLASSLRDEAATAPLRVPYGFVPLAGVHKDGMSLLAIVRGVYPRGIEGLEFVRSGTPADDERVNAVFRAWARREGWRGSPVQSASGQLEPSISSDVDFRKGSFDAQIGPGFHAWNFAMRSRWLSKRGSLTLPWTGQKAVVVEAHVPGAALRAAGILGQVDRVTVRVNGITIGAIDFTAGDFVSRTFTLPGGLQESVEVSLESSFSWHARQVYRDNLDPRELSISVIAVRLTD